MAAPYHRAVNASALRRSRFNDDDPPSPLPDGGCNFRDLSHGTRAPVCGCRRFWLNIANPNVHLNGGENAWCFCGHHACFHSAFTQQHNLSSALPSSHVSVHPETVIRPPAADPPDAYYPVHQAGALARQPAGLGIRPDTQAQSQSQSINTRVWEALNGFARKQEEQAYSDNASKLPSTAVPSVNGEATDRPRSMAPPVSVPPHSTHRYGFDELIGSATEVATPSIAGTPDFQAYVLPRSQARLSRPPETLPTLGEPAASVQQDHPQSPPPRQISTQEMQDMLWTYARRLDALESVSFSHVPLEEVQDKFELFDGRLLDLEQWRNEQQDRMQTSPEPLKSAEAAESSGSKRRRLLSSGDNRSFASDESFDSTAAAHAEAAVLATIAVNVETGPRIYALESRVADLENAALPTFTRPWEVQVVLLPWGRDLRGIWFSSTDATQHSMRASNAGLDEWSGAQSLAKISFQSSASAAWTTESIQAWAEDAQDWLSPKACGPTGTAFKRLASRGLVRDVTFTASDPRHILDVISGAFRKTLPSVDVEEPGPAEQYHGLCEKFLPLRKVRKSSRLRFLSPAEMITSASWTAGFLDSSVIMKCGDGQRRLYVTTPPAHLQGTDGGWTWKTLRELPPRDANGEQYAGQVDRTVAIEACWSYNDKLDCSHSLHSTFGLDDPHGSQWSIKSQQTTGRADQKAGNPTPASSSPDIRTVRQRTSSLPSSTSAHGRHREALPKRRVASFETVGTVPIVAGAELDPAKRRRISASPEAERRGVNFTPRWSREPPSPFHSDHAGDARSQGASSGRKRGSTPFAYATPHSNMNYVGPGAAFGDGDTERNTDIDDAGQAGEEWDGMEEAAVGPSDDDKSEDDEEEEDEDQDEDDDDDEHDDDVGEGYLSKGAA